MPAAGIEIRSRWSLKTDPPAGSGNPGKGKEPMSNFECTVTIADIYGAEWWERNKAELDREWEWGFGWIAAAKEYASTASKGIMPVRGGGELRIILHRRKPKPPTLREVYGVDEVTIPVGWQWTGEWRVPTDQESGAKAFAPVERHRFNSGNTVPYHRLILRERPKKVWFKAEETHRKSNPGDWAWVIDQWKLVGVDTLKPFTLCATRHEEIDSTVQVVTQAMVEEGVKV